MNCLQTCGVEQARSRLGVDRTQAVAFVACFFSESTWESNPMASANQCANQVFRFDTYALIWQCIKQEDKLYTFLRMRDDTEANGFTSCKAPLYLSNLFLIMIQPPYLEQFQFQR